MELKELLFAILGKLLDLCLKCFQAVEVTILIDLVVFLNEVSEILIIVVIVTHVLCEALLPIVRLRLRHLIDHLPKFVAIQVNAVQHIIWQPFLRKQHHAQHLEHFDAVLLQKLEGLN